MSNLPRRGRPPRVVVNEDGSREVAVRGVTYKFNVQNRPLGKPEPSEDLDYAKALISRSS